MDIRATIDARDSLQRRLDEARDEYRRLSATGFATSSRQQAKLSHLANVIERLERGIGRLNDLAADQAERGAG